MIVDVARCQGCNNCFLACKDEHGGNDWPGYSRPQSYHGERWIELPCNERGQYPLIDVAYRPTLCTHCADAPCVTRSGGAIYKRPDGIVLIDYAKAAGRRDLVDACPYGMISWSEESSAPQKCTLCAHLLDDGWSQPRCVQACGPGALSFVRGDDAGFASLAAAGGLETLYSGGIEGTGVCYRNLARFDCSFIAGSVAVQEAGVIDCAAGAIVTLTRIGGATDGDPLLTAVTDAFGDFKLDGLDPDGGEYQVQVAFNDFVPVRVTAVLDRSVNLGTIMVGGKR